MGACRSRGPSPWFRDGFLVEGLVDALGPHGAVGPDVGFLDLSDGPDQTISQRSRTPSPQCPWLPIWVATPISRATLVRRRFGDGVREGLLHVNVFAELHGHVGGRVRGVVVGREMVTASISAWTPAFAVVFELLGFGQAVEGLAGAVRSGSQRATTFLTVAVAGHDIAHALQQPTPMAAMLSFSLGDFFPGRLGRVGLGESRGLWWWWRPGRRAGSWHS